MESNVYSIKEATGLDRLAAVVEELAAEDLAALPDSAAAERVLVLRRLVDRLEGQWLRELAGVDGRGAAGADQGTEADSTAGWLRARLRAGRPQAARWVQTARALFRGPLAGTGQALADGDISPAHATALAHSAQQLPPATIVAAEPVLLDNASRLDPPTLRKVATHLIEVADPDGAAAQAQRGHERRGLWVSPTLGGMVAIDGLLEPEAGETLLTALEPLARPSSAEDDRSGSQRRADALTELARRSLEGGRLPQTGGVRPQLTVTIDLASLLGHHPTPGGEGAWVGPLPAETARRLACDAAVTRVLITRQLGHRASLDGHDRVGHAGDDVGGLAAGLRAAVSMLPPALGGAPTQPLEVGRVTRVVSAAQTGRAGGPRRRLPLPGLRPATRLVRGPSPAALVTRRRHGPSQPGATVPSPSSCGARRRTTPAIPTTTDRA